MGTQILRGLGVITAFSLLSLCPLGCSITAPPPADAIAAQFRDRCYIEDEQFLTADRLYARLGTLKLTENHLRREFQWRDCEVQETLYRLKKVHGLP